jgi:predicted metal-binding protein
MPKNSSVVVVRPRRASPLLICKKCLARSDEGKKLKRLLKSEVKRQSHLRSLKHPRKRSRVVMASCFGICPKHAVVIANGATLQRGEYLLVSNSKSVCEATALLMPADDVSSANTD